VVRKYLAPLRTRFINTSSPVCNVARLVRTAVPAGITLVTVDSAVDVSCGKAIRVPVSRGGCGSAPNRWFRLDLKSPGRGECLLQPYIGRGRRHRRWWGLPDLVGGARDAALFHPLAQGIRVRAMQSIFMWTSLLSTLEPVSGGLGICNTPPRRFSFNQGEEWPGPRGGTKFIPFYPLARADSSAVNRTQPR
jgi:hypothetical protein